MGLTPGKAPGPGFCPVWAGNLPGENKFKGFYNFTPGNLS